MIFITVKRKKPKIIHVQKPSFESRKNISTTIPPRLHNYDCSSSFGNVKHIIVHSEYYQIFGNCSSKFLRDKFV